MAPISENLLLELQPASRIPVSYTHLNLVEHEHGEQVYRAEEPEHTDGESLSV